MATSKQKDFILTGRIFPVLMSVSAPLMFNNLVRTFYTMADGLFLAQLSAEDFAASSFSWPLNFLFISIGLGIGVAATALLSHYIGAKQHERLQRYVDNTRTLNVTFGLGLALVGYLLSPVMLKWMGGSGVFLDKANIYLQISFIGLALDFGFFTYQAILNAQGQTKIMTTLSAISMVINILLDPFFIYDHLAWFNLPGLGWGIAGAAWATVISKGVLLVMTAVYVNRRSPIRPVIRRLSFDRATSHHILNLALPSALGYGGSSLGFTVMNALITSYGTNTLAAFSMVNRISDIVTQPQMGVGMALTSLVGQNMGAGFIDRAKQIFKQAIQFILIISILSSAVILLFQKPILSIFIKQTADSDLWLQAQEYLAYTAFIIFFMGLFSALNGFFQGCGQTKYSMFMTIARLWIIRVPLVFILRYWTDLGSTGIWISMLASNLLIVVWGFVIYWRNDWGELAKL